MSRGGATENNPQLGTHICGSPTHFTNSTDSTQAVDSASSPRSGTPEADGDTLVTRHIQWVIFLVLIATLVTLLCAGIAVDVNAALRVIILCC